VALQSVATCTGFVSSSSSSSSRMAGFGGITVASAHMTLTYERCLHTYITRCARNAPACFEGVVVCKVVQRLALQKPRVGCALYLLSCTCLVLVVFCTCAGEGQNVSCCVESI
jgi:hypothetical protein